MFHETEYTITRGDIDIDIMVEYKITDLIPAVGPSWNDPGAPAEGGEITSLIATLDGELFPLTDEEERKIEDHIHDTHDFDETDYWEE